MVHLGTVPAVGLNQSWWRGRPVFLTGHTGFKGGWLSLWLTRLGAAVTGYSLPPDTPKGIFTAAHLDDSVRSVFADIRDGERLRAAVAAARPEIVFHLAAQPLVRRAFAEPVETFATNLMGTVNLLEAARQVDSVRAVVVVTSDKVYDNREWVWGYREDDRLGGKEPYGASKACAEIATEAYRHAFFSNGRHVGVATARAGNVIGGGDWAEDRLVPDAIRAFLAGQTLRIRFPQATRPWQHVLEPLAGYIALAQRIHGDPQPFAKTWNFGPSPADVRSVADVANALVSLWGDGVAWIPDNPPSSYEARLLAVDSAKAIAELGWHPRWDVRRALQRTVDWYKGQASNDDMRALSLAQLAEYAHAA